MQSGRRLHRLVTHTGGDFRQSRRSVVVVDGNGICSHPAFVRKIIKVNARGMEGYGDEITSDHCCWRSYRSYSARDRCWNRTFISETVDLTDVAPSGRKLLGNSMTDPRLSTDPALIQDAAEIQSTATPPPERAIRRVVVRFIVNRLTLPTAHVCLPHAR